MSNKNMEMMKKIIEEKKKKSAEQGFFNSQNKFENSKEKRKKGK